MNQNKKILICSTVGYTIEAFLIPYLNYFHNRKYEVFVLANWNYTWNRLPEFAKKITIPFSRSLFSVFNISSFLKLYFLLNKTEFDLIYTHTPIVSFLVRLWKLLRKNNTPVIYEVHGFHFHQYGNRIMNKIYDWIESWLSQATDVIITINKDDYYSIKDRYLKPQIYYSPGIGVDTDYYSRGMYDQFPIPEDYPILIDKKKFVIITVANLIKRKNLFPIIKISAELKKRKIDFRWLIVGDGPLKKKLLKDIYKNQLENNCFLLGFQKDIRFFLYHSDLFVLLSLQEGLPRSLLEAAAMKVPSIVCNVRGNRDLVLHNRNSYLADPVDFSKVPEYIEELYSNPQKKQEFGNHLYKRCVNNFSLQKVSKIHEDIFKKVLMEKKDESH